MAAATTKNALVAWINAALASTGDAQVVDLVKDCADGVKLGRVLEVREGKTLHTINKRPFIRMQKLGNVNNIKVFITKAGGDASGVEPAAVVDGSEDAVVAFAWAVVRHYDEDAKGSANAASWGGRVDIRKLQANAAASPSAAAAAGDKPKYSWQAKLEPRKRSFSWQKDGGSDSDGSDVAEAVKSAAAKAAENVKARASWQAGGSGSESGGSPRSPSAIPMKRYSWMGGEPEPAPLDGGKAVDGGDGTSAAAAAILAKVESGDVEAEAVDVPAADAPGTVTVDVDELVNTAATGEGGEADAEEKEGEATNEPPSHDEESGEAKEEEGVTEEPPVENDTTAAAASEATKEEPTPAQPEAQPEASLDDMAHPVDGPVDVAGSEDPAAAEASEDDGDVDELTRLQREISALEGQMAAKTKAKKKKKKKASKESAPGRLVRMNSPGIQYWTAMTSPKRRKSGSPRKSTGASPRMSASPRSARSSSSSPRKKKKKGGKKKGTEEVWKAPRPRRERKVETPREKKERESREKLVVKSPRKKTKPMKSKFLDRITKPRVQTTPTWMRDPDEEKKKKKKGKKKVMGADFLERMTKPKQHITPAWMKEPEKKKGAKKAKPLTPRVKKPKKKAEDAAAAAPDSDKKKKKKNKKKKSRKSTGSLGRAAGARASLGAGVEKKGGKVSAKPLAFVKQFIRECYREKEHVDRPRHTDVRPLTTFRDFVLERFKAQYGAQKLIADNLAAFERGVETHGRSNRAVAVFGKLYREEWSVAVGSAVIAAQEPLEVASMALKKELGFFDEKPFAYVRVSDAIETLDTVVPEHDVDAAYLAVRMATVDPRSKMSDVAREGDAGGDVPPEDMLVHKLDVVTLLAEDYTARWVYTPGQVRKLLHRWDANRDGQVTREEFGFFALATQWTPEAAGATWMASVAEDDPGRKDECAVIASLAEHAEARAGPRSDARIVWEGKKKEKKEKKEKKSADEGEGEKKKKKKTKAKSATVAVGRRARPALTDAFAPPSPSPRKKGKKEKKAAKAEKKKPEKKEKKKPEKKKAEKKKKKKGKKKGKKGADGDATEEAELLALEREIALLEQGLSPEEAAAQAARELAEQQAQAAQDATAAADEEEEEHDAEVAALEAEVAALEMGAESDEEDEDEDEDEDGWGPSPSAAEEAAHEFAPPAAATPEVEDEDDVGAGPEPEHAAAVPADDDEDDDIFALPKDTEEEPAPDAPAPGPQFEQPLYSWQKKATEDEDEDEDEEEAAQEDAAEEPASSPPSSGQFSWMKKEEEEEEPKYSWQKPAADSDSDDDEPEAPQEDTTPSYGWQQPAAAADDGGESEEEVEEDGWDEDEDDGWD